MRKSPERFSGPSNRYVLSGKCLCPVFPPGFYVPVTGVNYTDLSSPDPAHSLISKPALDTGTLWNETVAFRYGGYRYVPVSVFRFVMVWADVPACG